MLRWSIPLFRIRGIQLAVHGSFFLLLAYVAWAGAQPSTELEGLGGWLGVAWSVALLLAFFTCVVLHELGHSFMAMRFGVGVRRILLMPIGGMAEFDSIPREPRRELLITAAGPLVNFVLAFGFWFVIRDLPDEVPYYSFGAFASQLLWANLVMGIFNLLPAFPMDGGRLLRAIVATRRPYLRATWWAALTGKIVCALGILAALTVSLLGYADLWLLVVLFAFIALAGELEYRAIARREQEAEHWRQVLARWYQKEPPPEPPLLASSPPLP